MSDEHSNSTDETFHSENVNADIKNEILSGDEIANSEPTLDKSQTELHLNGFLSLSEAEVNSIVEGAIGENLCEINLSKPRPKSKRKQLFCEQCQYSTFYKNHLKLHVDAVHKGERPFCCTQCQYKAGWKNDLKRHISSVHKGERLYKCPHCEYTSGWKYDLNRHISSSHRGDKSHPCPHCHFSTHRKDVLNRHVSSVHCGDKPHACPHCNFTASQKNNLKTHIQKIHKEIPT